MYKFILACILTTLLFAVPLSLIISEHDGRLEKEGRSQVPFPTLPQKINTRTIKNYFRALDSFHSDNFLFRNLFIKTYSEVNEILKGNLNINKCYRGKEGWLFLGDDFNGGVSKLQGRARLTDDAILSSTNRYKKLSELSRRYGADFILLIGPNKSTIYSEYLPPVIYPSPKRYIEPLVRSLQSSGVNVYDSTLDLIENKNKALLYYRTDTHWNAQGAHIAFEGLLAQLTLPKLPALMFKPGPQFHGDLLNIGGLDSFPLQTGDNFIIAWNNSFAPEIIADGKISKVSSSAPGPEKRNGEIVMNRQASTDKVAWVLGDSFTMALFPYFNATFKEVRYFNRADYGPEKLAAALEASESKPDIIVEVVVERSL